MTGHAALELFFSLAIFFVRVGKSPGTQIKEAAAATLQVILPLHAGYNTAEESLHCGLLCVCDDLFLRLHVSLWW